MKDILLTMDFDILDRYLPFSYQTSAKQSLTTKLTYAMSDDWIRIGLCLFVGSEEWRKYRWGQKLTSCKKKDAVTFSPCEVV